MSVTIKDAYLSAAGSVNVINREFGAASKLLPRQHKDRWHRINVEMSLSRIKHETEEINSLLYEGFVSTLESQQKIYNQLDLTNQYISECNTSIDNLAVTMESGVALLGEKIEDISGRIDKQNEILTETLNVLTNISKAVNSPRATEACELTRRAEKNFSLLRHADEIQGQELIKEAKLLVQEALELDSHNWHAYYNAGWLSFFFDANFEAAARYFDLASLRSIQDDKVFSAFALRMKAEALSRAEKNSEALSEALKAQKLNEDLSPRIEVDLARYFILDAKLAEANKIILGLLKTDPANLVLVTTDQVLGNSKDILEYIGRVINDSKEKAKLAYNDEYNRFIPRLDYLESKLLNESLFNLDLRFFSDIRKDFLLSLNSSLDQINESPFPNPDFVVEKLNNHDLSYLKEKLGFLEKHVSDFLYISSMLEEPCPEGFTRKKLTLIEEYEFSGDVNAFSSKSERMYLLSEELSKSLKEFNAKVDKVVNAFIKKHEDGFLSKTFTTKKRKKVNRNLARDFRCEAYDYVLSNYSTPNSLNMINFLQGITDSSDSEVLKIRKVFQNYHAETDAFF